MATASCAGKKPTTTARRPRTRCARGNARWYEPRHYEGHKPLAFCRPCLFLTLVSQSCRCVRTQANLERIEAEERRRREDASTVADLERAAEPNAPIDRMQSADALSRHAVGSKQLLTALNVTPVCLTPSSASRRIDNPYEPTVAMYGKILRKDVFLLFRRLWHVLARNETKCLDPLN